MTFFHNVAIIDFVTVVAPGSNPGNVRRFTMSTLVAFAIVPLAALVLLTKEGETIMSIIYIAIEALFTNTIEKLFGKMYNFFDNKRGKCRALDWLAARQAHCDVITS